MKKNKSIFKCWKLVWHIKIGFFIGVQNQKTRKMLKKLKKIANLALQGVFLGQLKKQNLLNNKKKGLN